MNRLAKCQSFWEEKTRNKLTNLEPELFYRRPLQWQRNQQWPRLIQRYWNNSLWAAWDKSFCWFKRNWRNNLKLCNSGCMKQDSHRVIYCNHLGADTHRPTDLSASSQSSYLFLNGKITKEILIIGPLTFLHQHRDPNFSFCSCENHRTIERQSL